MANPWDQDEIVQPAPGAAAPMAMGAAAGNPWDADPIVGEAPALELDIVGGTPISSAEFEAQEQARQKPANPSLFRMDSDFKQQAGVGAGTMLSAAARDMFGSRESTARYLAEQAGGTVDQDVDGSPVVVLPDGSAYRLNDAGIDSADVANVAGNIAAFWTPAQWAARIGQARKMGLAGRALTQATAAGATDATLQAGFSDDYSVGRTAAAAAGGAGGELLGTGVGALVRRATAAGRSVSGANQQAAQGLLDQSGVQAAPENILARLAPRMEEVRAGTNPNALVGAERYGFAYTKGQRTADPELQRALLTREELLRQSPGGEALHQAQRQNVEQLDTALGDLGGRLGGRPGATPAELAQGAASRVSQQAEDLSGQIGQAYERAGQGSRAAISADSVRELPARLRAAVADFSPNASLTPAAAKTLDQIKLATDTILQGAEGSSVRGVTLKALETQRRILSNNISAAANPSDRAATTAIKREFDRWLDEAVDGALVSGDPQALAAIKEARGLRAEFGRRFEGGADSDRFIAGLLDGTRTPEELVNIALGASQVSKSSGARFIERLRQAAGDDPGVVGNLRAAHFLRMTRGNNGEPLNMGQIIRNIRQTEYSNASIMRALYSPAEWKEIRTLAGTLEPLVAKGDFAKSSGTGERLARMFFQKFGVQGWPLVGNVAQAIERGSNSIRAERALNQPLRLPGQAPAGFVPASSATAAEGVR